MKEEAANLENHAKSTPLHNYTRLADSIPKMEHDDLMSALEKLIKTIQDVDERRTVVRSMEIVMCFSDYENAPASTNFHLNTRHGLFRHSLGVAYRLLALDGSYDIMADYSCSDVILCALLHDLGKAGQVELRDSGKRDFTVGGRVYEVIRKPYYVLREHDEKSGHLQYRRSRETVMMAVPAGSLHFISTMLSDVWKPSPDVWQSICYHDGQYVGEGSHVAHQECKLLIALHHADIFQSRVESKWMRPQSNAGK